MNNKSVIIIGAGLSGLILAHRLGQQGFEVTVLEARDRIGGRILSQDIDSSGQASIDLGPSWVWPQFQPRLSGLLNELNIDVFAQFTDGDSLYQLQDGRVERHASPSAHAQSFRIVGGAHALVNKLFDDSATQVHLNTRVLSIDAVNQTVIAVKDQEEVAYTADRVITALPLRLLAETVQIKPDIEAEFMQLWQSIPTWMAGHCKIVFVYATPFWREQGLSGEVYSHHGPLSEIYDGSPYPEEENETAFALTSFVGLNALQRKGLSSSQLIDACLSQLELLFGSQAKKAEQVLIKDWSNESATTRPADLTGAHQHPHYPASLPRQFLHGYLNIAGTEAAVENGGYIEGALESADVIVQLSQNWGQ